MLGKLGFMGATFCLIGIAPGLGVQQAFAFQDDVLTISFETGRIIEDVSAPGDPSQSFSLYIPTAYSENEQWPIVFVMDPRGRGLVPLQKLVSAAERLGYIVASSNNTASDAEGDPNAPAVNAMIATLQPRLSLDLQRFYLFGMSGTARAAWGLGYAAIPHVAGVAGFAAGIPPDMNLEAAQGQYGAPFVFYGAAGDRDFNHAELVQLEGRLRRLGFRYSVSYYPGRHGWPQQEAEFDAALSWMHLMAMQRGLLEVDSAWVIAEHDRRLEAGRELEKAESPELAWAAFSSIVADFSGLLSDGGATDRASVLASVPEVTAWRAQRIKLARAHMAYKDVAAAWLQEAMTWNPSLQAALEALAVDSLKTQAATADNPYSAAAAERALADLHSLTSFYHPRFHVDRRDWRRARLSLEIADSIYPGTARVCRQLERVLDELGADPGSSRSPGCASGGNSGSEP